MRNRGFTLIEMSISMVFIGVIGGIVFLTTDSTSNAVRTGIAVAELDARALRALERVCEGLKTSSSDLTTPQVASPLAGVEVDFQRGLGTDDAGATQWGPPEQYTLDYDEDDDGADDDGDGLVDEGVLVWLESPGLAGERRVVVTNGVREYLEGETLDGTDENGNGLIDERGFCLEWGTNRVTVHLTLAGRDAHGNVLVSTVERTVSFRNEGD